MVHGKIPREEQYLNDADLRDHGRLSIDQTQIKKYGSFDLDNDCLLSLAMRLESQILFQKSKLDSK